MYTLLDLHSSIVLYTGLTRAEMKAKKTNRMRFCFEPDYATTPQPGMKLDYKTHDFVNITGNLRYNEIRRLLDESDWRMTTDYPGTDKEDWVTYRQSLRVMLKDEDEGFPTRPTTT
jgi:hypothetical protein